MAPKKDLRVLAAQIDRVGTLQQQIEVARLKIQPTIDALQKKITEAEEKFRESVADLTTEVNELMPIIASAVPDGTTLSGEKFVAASTLTRSVRELGFDLVRKKIGQKKWNEISTVTIKELTNIMGKEDLDACVTGQKSSYALVVKSLT
jgi:seryl-tRNA synthetase